MKTLVIAAHPDDEVLGCGGTAAKLARAGTEVYMAILGEGSTSRFPQRAAAEPALVAALQTNSQQVASLLQVKELFTYKLPDNRFDEVSLLDIVKIIETLISRLEPEVIYTQHGGDLNIDHMLTYRATLTATRPIAGRSVKAVYAYEVASSTEWAFQKFSPAFHPNTFVDIADTLNLKLRAMELYETETRPFPHPRSREALQVQARHWGSMVGVPAAEAFELIWKIR